MPKLNIERDIITLQHGSGGRASQQLIDTLFRPAFNDPELNKGNDQAQLFPSHTHLVMSTDSHVIQPLFFPGGNIGKLSVCGTINDIAMAGATPRYMAINFILEEGLPLLQLQKIVNSIADTAHQAEVALITGDTKVVERGKGDGIFITTTGVGIRLDNVNRGAESIQTGDAIIISGSLGDHAIAIMSARKQLGFTCDLDSDCKPLHSLVASMISVCPQVNCMRDPTRGGLSAILNELAHQRKVGMVIDEDKLPIKPAVSAACEVLGLEPINLANEGKLVAFCPQEQADTLLSKMRSHPDGQDAQIIGCVIEDSYHRVTMRTRFGGNRLVDWKYGDTLPRIC